VMTKATTLVYFAIMYYKYIQTDANHPQDHAVSSKAVTWMTAPK
jgi:hypothetical protein